MSSKDNTTKRSYLIAFNNHLKEFIHKIRIILPDDEKIKLVDNMFHAGLVLNQTLYITRFNDVAVVCLEDDILARNEAVFLEKDFSFIPEIKEQNVSVDEFKTIWIGLSDKYKNVIWDYLKVLIVLSKRYHM